MKTGLSSHFFSSLACRTCCALVQNDPLKQDKEGMSAGIVHEPGVTSVWSCTGRRRPFYYVPGFLRS